MFKPKYFQAIPLPLPHRRIMSRLGYNRHRTVLHRHHEAVLESAILLAFSRCRIQGAMLRIPITEHHNDHICLPDGTSFASNSLAALLKDSEEALLLAATAGKEIIDAVNHEIDEGNAARAAIFDAVGSETADAALGWLQEFTGRGLPRENRSLTEQRFSPGYGDLGLDTQKAIFKILSLEKLGLSLTDRLMLVPEKSVIGILGIRKMD